MLKNSPLLTWSTLQHQVKLLNLEAPVSHTWDLPGQFSAPDLSGVVTGLLLLPLACLWGEMHLPPALTVHSQLLTAMAPMSLQYSS